MNDLRLLAGFALILFCLTGCNKSEPASPIVQKVESRWFRTSCRGSSGRHGTVAPATSRHGQRS